MQAHSDPTRESPESLNCPGCSTSHSGAPYAIVFDVDWFHCECCGAVFTRALKNRVRHVKGEYSDS